MPAHGYPFFGSHHTFRLFGKHFPHPSGVEGNHFFRQPLSAVLPRAGQPNSRIDMRALPFFKLSPGGNTTALLVADNISPEQQRAAALEALHPLHLFAEQVGFVSPLTPELHMAGGEFCINATRSLGLLLALEERLPSQLEENGQKRWRGEVRTSGIPRPVILEVTRTADGYDSALHLRLPDQPEPERPDPGVALVRLPGITHLLLEEALHPFPQDWRADAALLLRRYGLESEDAAGCVWWRGTMDNLHSSPVVTVKEPHTVIFETACGSGALALALALAQDANGWSASGRYSVMQPSGMPMDVALAPGEAGMDAVVSGPVRLIARGEVWLRSLGEDA